MSDYDDNERDQRRRDLERADVEGRYASDRGKSGALAGCLDSCGGITAAFIALAALIAVAVATMVG